MHCTCCFSIWWKWLKWKHCACCFLMWSYALYVHCVSTIFCALSFLRFTFGQTSIDQENQGSLTESIQYVNLLLQCLMLKPLKAEVKVITIQKNGSSKNSKIHPNILQCIGSLISIHFFTVTAAFPVNYNQNNNDFSQGKTPFIWMVFWPMHECNM